MSLWFLTLIVTALIPTRSFAFDQSYKAFAEVLRRTVSVTGASSSVNYTALQADPRMLNEFTQEVQQVSRTEFEAMSKDQRLALLINAYNALTLKLVADHFPVKSIKDIGGIFSSPWTKEFFTLFGEKHSLDYIEHKMIRPVFKDPRVHFALVCASKGCPKLQDKPYLPITLDAQLSQATEEFLIDGAKNSYDANGNRFSVSSIFKWYSDDFVNEAGSVQSFLTKYMRLKNPKSLGNENSAVLEYRSYDWSLNGH